MPVGFVPFSNRHNSAMINQNPVINPAKTEMADKPTAPSNSTDERVVVVATTAIGNETSLIPNEEADQKRSLMRGHKVQCRTFHCSCITFLALTTLFCISLVQVNQIGNDEYQQYVDQRNALGNDTNAIDTLTTTYDTRTAFLRDHYGPAIGAGVVSLLAVPMYIGNLKEDNNSKVSRVAFTTFGAGTIVAGGFATAAGLTVGGPIMIAVGTSSVLTGLASPKKIFEIRKKIDAAVCNVWTKVCCRFRNFSSSEI